MQRGTMLAVGETYHIYNRGAHKQEIFLDPEDYDRFLALMYVANNTESIHLCALLERKYKGILIRETDLFECEAADQSLVNIRAYCLMPNHFHIIIEQRADNGIETFMRRVATGYSMYFNIKHAHSGVVFQGRFKSRWINNEAYYRYMYTYIHLNPLKLIEPQWKEVGILHPARAHEFLQSYRYSSYPDYAAEDRPERAILSFDGTPEYLDEYKNIRDLIRWYGNLKSLFV